MPCCVLAVVNQKGGVGKTTTTVNLAAFLAARGKRTLLLDLDSQGNATSGLGLSKSPNQPSSYHLLVDQKPLEELVQKTSRKQLQVCPASIDLAGGEVELVNLPQREYRLKQALEQEKSRYDYILIDCPPSLGLLTLNAMTAADGLIIPVQGEYYALEGVTQLMETLSLVNQSLNPDLRIFGVVVTLFDARTTLAQQVEQEVRNYFEDLAFKTVIPRNVRLSEAPSYGQSILEYDAKSKGAQAYHELAREVIRRTKPFMANTTEQGNEVTA